VDKIYDFYVFNLSNLNEVANKFTVTQQTSTDHVPYLFADDSFIYLSNNGNNTADDFKVRSYFLNSLAIPYTLTQSSDITLNSDFQKSTNYFIKDSKFYTFIGGNIYSYPFTGETRNFEKFLNNTNGQVFTQDSKVYFRSGFIGNLWNI